MNITELIAQYSDGIRHLDSYRRSLNRDNPDEARAKIAKARFDRLVDESAAYGISCPSGRCDV